MFLDIITCLLVAFGFYQGFSRGLIKTVFATLSLVIGIVAALKLSPIVIGLLQNSLNISPAITFVLGFVLTFIVVMALIRVIGNSLQKAVKSIHIGGIDKLLGGIILGLFYALLVSFGVYFVDKVELISDENKQASFTYPLLEPMPRAAQGIGEKVRPIFNEFWSKMLETMDAVKEKGEEISPN